MQFHRVICHALLCVLLCAGSVVLAATAKPVVYDIPRLDNITLDGNGADWGTRGFRVDAVHDISEGLSDCPRTALSDVTMRLGWDARGMLMLINVVDVSPLEDDKEDSLWRKDSVELYMADKLGGKEHYQILVAPGVDNKHPDIRIHYYDFRNADTLKATQLTCTAARVKTATGYVMEALLPWSNLGITPALGLTVGTQFMINDYDPQGALWHKLWYPQPGAAFFSDRMCAVRLAATPSAPVQLQAYCYQERFHHIVISAIGTAEQTGKTLTVREGRHLLGSEKMTAADHDRSMAEVLLPLTPAGKQYQTLTASINGQQFSLNPAPIYFDRMKAIMRLQIAFSAGVFSGAGFPNGDFTDPALAENLLGRYTLRTTYYDAGYHAVNSAETPGRYGALVEVNTENGVKFRRYVTLYRLPDQVSSKEDDAAKAAREQRDAAIVQSLLQEINVKQPVIQEQAPMAADMFQRITSGYARLPESAVYLAGLAEIAPGSGAVTTYSSARSRDARWWYGLRQQLGISETYPYVVLHPDGFGTDTTRRYPLVVSLHGSGGTEVDFETFKKEPVDKGLAEFTRTKYPCIVLAPFSQVGGWSPEMVDALVTEILAKEPVDPDRVYLTGLSMGGFGAWITAAAYPQRYAAVVPICGGGDTHDAARLKDMPIWAFHGEADESVNVAFSKDMVKAINDAGGHPKLTLYPGIGHGSWGPAYADPALYEWLFQQKRGQK